MASPQFKKRLSRLMCAYMLEMRVGCADCLSGPLCFLHNKRANDLALHPSKYIDVKTGTWKIQPGENDDPR